MNALGQCNGIINDGVPVHMAQAYAMFRAGGERDFRLDTLKKFMEYGWIDRLGGRTRLLWTKVADSTRLSYARAFGISPALQVMIEEYFSGVCPTAGAQTLPSLHQYYSRLHVDLFKHHTV